MAINILVLGYFGYETNQLDGQTVKTRNLYELFESKKDNTYNLKYFDTQSLKRKKGNLLRMFSMVFKSDIIIYLPAHNNLKFFFPIIFIISSITGSKLHYFVVGGWLNEYIKNKPVHEWMLSKIESIYPESKALADSLGFKNITRFPNFRNHIHNAVITEVNPQVRLVFMARIQEKKGVGTLFKLAEVLEKEGINIIVDLYGPIDASYEHDFIAKAGRYLKLTYKGVAQPFEIYSILNSYDLMLFPTQHYTEGFPGSILDAYIAGIPVAATNWKHAAEFINDGVSGVITPWNDEDTFIDEVLKLCYNTTLLYSMKKSALQESLKYSSESAWKVIKEKVLN